MHQMGGLAKKMPITALAFGVGAAALAGVPPFSGFWSKDEILAAAAAGPYPVLYWAGLVTAALTAFYITRVVVLTYAGKARTEDARYGHESPAVMAWPLLVLTVLAALTGLAGSPWLGNPWLRFMGGTHHVAAGAGTVTLWATGMALGGILLGLLTYAWPVIPRARLIVAGRPVYQLLKNKYYVDEFYRAVVIKPVMGLAKICGRFDLGIIDRLVNAVGSAGVLFSRWAGVFDTRVVDGAVNGVAQATVQAGQGVRRLQTGYAATYLLTFILGVVGALVIYQIVQ
jgi:NADH-quinone oxidoreductase subunit L